MAAGGLSVVRSRLAAAAARGGRDPADVTLVAVSKGRSPEAIMAVYEEGHRVFGENRPEELAEKAPLLPGDITWHMVGTVQRRKVALAGPHTALLHSLDRESLVARWAALPEPSPVLVQVNLAREPQKHGVDPSGVSALVALAGDAGLDVQGLMIIPPLPERPEDSRRWFIGLRELRDELCDRHPTLRELSMGMTDDFEVAVEEGATFIRVGRAIFGNGSA
jgi:pyridoxal phosphate enzyme (YggS family)